MYKGMTFMYTVDEAFEILKRNKITTSKESVRRWLRDGVIEAAPPATRKQGWRIAEDALDRFIAERLPEGIVKENEGAPSYTTDDLKAAEERGRTEMWNRVAGRWLWEGHLEIKRKMIRDAVEHMRYTKEFEELVWQRVVANSKSYSKPRVFYLIDAFLFENERVLYHPDFGGGRTGLEESIVFAILDKVRLDLKSSK